MNQNPLVDVIPAPRTEARKARRRARRLAQLAAARVHTLWACAPAEEQPVVRKPARTGEALGDYLIRVVPPPPGNARAQLFESCPVVFVSNGFALVDADAVPQ